MTIREHEIRFGTGSLIVRDYGGKGPVVLLVHSPGYCAAAWDRVAGALAGGVRALAIDLPGHGGSTAPMRRAEYAWNSVITVTRELGLRTPLLVGLSQGSHTCLAASAEEPEMFSGIVSIGGACVRTREQTADEIAFYTSPQFEEVLRQRFFFGYKGTTEKEADALIDRMVARLGTDWRVIGFKGLRDETRYSIRPDPDGEGWINLPTPTTIQRMLTIDERDRAYPDERIYRRIKVPVVIVQLSEGLDQEHAERERDLAVRNPLISVRGLDAAEYPHYTRYQEVAAIIRETCGLTQRPVVSSTEA